MVFSDESPDNELTTDTKKPAITREHIELIAQHMKNTDSEHVKQRHHSHHSRIEASLEDNRRRHKNRNTNENDDATDIKELIAMNRVKNMKRHRKLFDEFDVKYDDEKESNKRTKIKSNLIEELLENSETRRVIRSVDEAPMKLHRRRSIYDNELPYEKLHADDVSSTLTTTDAPEPVTEYSPKEEEDDKNLIPYPPGTERKKKRRGRKGKRKTHKSRTTKIREEWNKVIIYDYY